MEQSLILSKLDGLCALDLERGALKQLFGAKFDNHRRHTVINKLSSLQSHHSSAGIATSL